MLRDQDSQVVTNCLTALNEIMADEGGMAVNNQIVTFLLNRLTEFNEWGQCVMLETVSQYRPVGEDEMFSIMNLLDPLVKSANSAVVLAATKCMINMTQTLKPEMVPQVRRRRREGEKYIYI